MFIGIAQAFFFLARMLVFYADRKVKPVRSGNGDRRGRAGKETMCFNERLLLKVWVQSRHSHPRRLFILRDVSSKCLSHAAPAARCDRQGSAAPKLPHSKAVC